MYMEPTQVQRDVSMMCQISYDKGLQSYATKRKATNDLMKTSYPILNSLNSILHMTSIILDSVR